jgi:hypothetical protein
LRTAKHDVTSFVLPMTLQVKFSSEGLKPTEVEWETLLQALENALTRSRLSAFLSKVVAFAATGRVLWCISCMRSCAVSSRRPSVLLNLSRMHLSDFSSLWTSITTTAAQDPMFFLTADGPNLLHAVRATGVDPFLCRVKWLARSMSVAYSVSAPRLYKSRVETVGVAGGRPDFVVKLVSTHQEFCAEKSALTAIASHDARCYALGTLVGGSNGTVFV